MNAKPEFLGAGEDMNQSPISPAQTQQGGIENAEIVPANVRALEAIYFAAMLEEAHVFDVVDQLVAMFGRGLLPLSHGRAGATLYRYWPFQ
jgi:hypothetical protein